MTTKSCAGLA